MVNKSRTYDTVRTLTNYQSLGSPVERTYIGRNHEQMDSTSAGFHWWMARTGPFNDYGNPWLKEGWIQSHRLGQVDIVRQPNLWLIGDQVADIPRDAGNATERSLYWPSLLGGAMNPTTAGATAIARCAPTVPAADSLVALAELYREGVPKRMAASLTGKQIDGIAKPYANEYLNYQFGWKPFVNDLRSLAKAVYESDDILQQLQKNSGKHVRRRYSFPPITENTTTVGTGLPYPNPSVYLRETPTYTKTTLVTKTVETWFSGAFSYYVDLKGSSSFERVKAAADKARLLYGLKLTPDVLWNLLPYSWAVDWQSNMGDIMTNVGLFANDGLVMHYGYVMQKHVSIRTVEMSPSYWGGKTLNLESKFERHKKARYRASPWGFGVELGDLTGRQIAILAALGISRF